MTKLTKRLITVQDMTTPGTLTPQELWNLVWALNYQTEYHYGRSPWVEREYASPASVALLPKGAVPPRSAWRVELLDQSDEPGAIAYHEDKAFDLHPSPGLPSKASAVTSRGLAEGTMTPLSKVGVKTARENGIDPCAASSHEVLEMLCDPYVVNAADVRKVLHQEAKQFVIVEIADPVQNNDYDVGAPQGVHVGIKVSDFVFPAWFAMPQTRPDLSFRKSVIQPFELAPGGYTSVAPEADPNNWSQIFGELIAAENFAQRRADV